MVDIGGQNKNNLKKLWQTIELFLEKMEKDVLN